MKFIILAAKLSLSLGIGYLVYRKIPASTIEQSISDSFVLRHHLLVALVFTLQGVLGALRLGIIGSLFNRNLKFPFLIKSWFYGSIVGQTVVTFISGDVLRAWLLRKDGATLLASAEMILLDRVAGLVVLLAMVILITFPLFEYLSAPMEQLMLAGTSIFALFVCIVFMSSSRLPTITKWLPSRLSTDSRVQLIVKVLSISRYLISNPQKGLLIVLTSFVMHSCNIFAFWLISLNFASGDSTLAMVLIVPIVMFFTLLPISYAGWGVREGSIIFGLALFGFSKSDSLAISVYFGIDLLLTTALLAMLIFILSMIHQVLRFQESPKITAQTFDFETPIEVLEDSSISRENL